MSFVNEFIPFHKETQIRISWVKNEFCRFVNLPLRRTPPTMKLLTRRLLCLHPTFILTSLKYLPLEWCKHQSLKEVKLNTAAFAVVFVSPSFKLNHPKILSVDVQSRSHVHSKPHLLVRSLYKTRWPQSLHLMGSPLFNGTFALQSPQR
jgi:hypothetical protein